MRVNILTIGRELLEGRVDTNAAWLAESLTHRGITVGCILTVGDDPPAVVAAIRDAARDAQAVVMTGGLGVTPDDLTRRALAEATGAPLVEDTATRERLAARYASEARPFTNLARAQSHLPEGASLLPNPVGLAPGIRVTVGGVEVFAMPGVPAEMRGIAEGSVFPALMELGQVPERAVRVLSLWGMSEADASVAIGPIAAASPDISVSYLPTHGRLELVFSSRATDGARARRSVSAFATRARRRLGGVVFASGTRGRSLEDVVGETLAKRRLTLAIAESCTGGRIGALMTRVPGSSAYIDRVMVTYSNRAKEQELGVPRALLARHGAVSAEVAEAMARGVRRVARTDFGLATTGIAGPTGGTPAKPVGLVYIAVASARRVAVKAYRFGGSRERVQERSAYTAIDALRLWLDIMEARR